MNLRVWLDDVAEVLEPGQPSTPVPLVLTCDHASVRMPPPWTWSPQDLWLAGTHWSYDLGAGMITRELATRLQAAAALSRFTRLLADANRCEAGEHLFRSDAEGQAVYLNLDLDLAQKERRLAVFHRAYHQRVESLIARHHGAAVVGIHSFTPVYNGVPRAMELGVLFNCEDQRACALAQTLRSDGWVVALNQPYSGYDHLMHGVECHARKLERHYLTVEVRQDIAIDSWRRGQLIDSLARALPLHLPRT